MVDPIGGALAEPSLRALGDGGRYLVIGFASGTIPSVPLNQVLLRNRSVLGIDWGIWAMGTRPSSARCWTTCWPWWPTGRSTRSTRPSTRSTSGRALDDLLGRRAVGKIALIDRTSGFGRTPPDRGAQGHTRPFGVTKVSSSLALPVISQPLECTT